MTRNIPRRALLFALFTAAAQFLFSIPALANDGTRLLQSCETFLATSRIVGDEGLVTQSDYDTGYCLGSIFMLQRLSVFTFGDHENLPALRICAPPETRASQLARIVVNYLRDHPQSLHENGADLAWEALANIYSCER